MNTFYTFTILMSILTLCAPLPNSYSKINNNSDPPPKLSLADSAESIEYNIKNPEGPGTYSFGYEVEDPQSGNVQFRNEERLLNGTVSGSYGFVTPEGSVHVVHYIADNFGYRTKVEEIKKQLPNQQTLNNSFDFISPEVMSALDSFENYDKKEDQHVRPANKNQFIAKKRLNHIYNVYFVPPKQKHN